jgi:hypothetical protein
MRDARDIRDANGALVAVGVSSADARLIVDAVNERDRLRDLVKRLARVTQDALDFANALSGIIPDNPEREKARNEIAEILAEARAAIGEDKG